MTQVNSNSIVIENGECQNSNDDTSWIGSHAMIDYYQYIADNITIRHRYLASIASMVGLGCGGSAKIIYIIFDKI
jgi:hypothetical protein